MAMSDWLDLMLEEVARKRRERKEAEEEQDRRTPAGKPGQRETPAKSQSK